MEKRNYGKIASAVAGAMLCGGAALALLCGGVEALACTNLIAGKKATADGSVLMTYAADSHNLYGMLTNSPAADHPKGSMRKVVDWDSGKPLGEIPQVAHTYNVVGNINEHQVAIGESTWGGHKELRDTTGQALIDYGSLIQIALERSKSAREAIDVMTDLVDKYGYASSGESFSIIDKDEAWVLELIGKGAEKGAVWIAVRIPDDAISGHANEPRIRKVNLKDKKNVKYSKDLISFARKRGYFNGKDEDFSFADAFENHDAGTRRGCDGRVWSYFNRFSPEAAKDYFAWVDYKSDEPMPLYIIPEKKVDLKTMQAAMRDVFQDTPYDMTKDVGAGPNHVPYRWRPMEFKVDGKTYCHERAIGTQQTGWSFVAQTRNWLPDAVGGVLWFGTDDTNTTVYMPMYCGMTEVPLQLQPGDINTFSYDSNFWMNNWVANQCYNRYDLMIPDVRKVQNRIEDNLRDSRPEIEAIYSEMAVKNPEGLVERLNEDAAEIAGYTTLEYKELAEYLLVRFMDGNMKKTDENGKFIKNEWGIPVYPDFPGYDENYYKRIVDETGDHFLLPD